MLRDIGQLALGFVLPIGVGYLWHRVGLLRCGLYGCWAWSAFSGAAGAALPPPGWALSCSSAVSGLVAVVLWWLSRRRRKRAPELAGDKSRALLAAMAAKLRETLKSRPVLRPVPGGAG